MDIAYARLIIEDEWDYDKIWRKNDDEPAPDNEIRFSYNIPNFAFVAICL
jgi:hypothetical protein